MVMFSLITCFPSLTRHSSSGSQANKICQYLLGVSTINAVVSSQRLYNVAPQLQHPLLPLGNIPQYLSRWEHVNCQLPTCRYNTGVRCGVCTAKLLRRNNKNGAIAEQLQYEIGWWDHRKLLDRKFYGPRKKLQQADQVRVQAVSRAS
jgi:hypothetical protein